MRGMIVKFANVEEAREFFSSDRFAVENGMYIDELGEGWCRCSFDISERQTNANGKVMGGAIFTLADFAVAVASCNLHWPTVSQQANITFLKPAKGSRLSAMAKCRKDGRTICVYTVDVTDELGTDVAQLSLTCYKL